eukprot:s4598_g2.t1
MKAVQVEAGNILPCPLCAGRPVLLAVYGVRSYMMKFAMTRPSSGAPTPVLYDTAKPSLRFFRATAPAFLKALSQLSASLENLENQAKSFCK